MIDQAPIRQINASRQTRNVNRDLVPIGISLEEMGNHLCALESLVFRAYVVWNSKGKLHHVHKALRPSSGLRNSHEEPPIALDYPDCEEERINNLEIVIPSAAGGEYLQIAQHPELIAIAKATRTLDRPLGFFATERSPALPDARNTSEAHVLRVFEYLQFVWMVGMLEKSDPSRISLAPSSPVNPHGILVPSIAHDIMSYRVIDGAQFPLHQLKNGVHSTDEYFTYLSEMFGQSLEMRAQFEVRDGTAVHELISDVAGVVRRQATIDYDCMNEDILRGFAYGIRDMAENNPVRRNIEWLWGSYGIAHAHLFAGWTPEKGMPVDRALRINGGLPNQCPILWLGRSDCTMLIEKKDFEGLVEKNRGMVEIVSGNPTSLPLLLRALSQTLLSEQRLPAMLDSEETRRFQRINLAILQSLGDQTPRVFPPYVIDFTDTLEQYRPTQEYLSELRTALTTPIRT